MLLAALVGKGVILMDPLDTGYFSCTILLKWIKYLVSFLKEVFFFFKSIYRNKVDVYKITRKSFSKDTFKCMIE